MYSRLVWGLSVALIAVVALLASACSPGGSTTPPPGGALSLRITTDRTSGPAPLTVNFFVTPSGGTAPYTYEWDFNDDGVVDSNASSGTFTFTTSTIARVNVTDSRGILASTSQSITITPPGTGPQPGEIEELRVRFNANPQFGQVPLPVDFTAVVTGGRLPYQYAWDFEGDGVFDNFTPTPTFTYTRVGQNLGDGRYVFYPVLRITDARGIVATNLDDLDQNGLPDFRLEINALPPDQGLFVTATGNPQAGQAPLTVEFVAATSGGSPQMEFRWNFGDGTLSNFTNSSLITHTYEDPGTYNAVVTARDLQTGLISASAPLTITAAQSQPFAIEITSDITRGTVPFVVNFSASPTNGKEPIQYDWIVWDHDAANPNPGPGNPGSLDPSAVVTPRRSNRKDLTVHFGNTSTTAGEHDYRVRVTATDAAGAQRVSSFRIISALPHTQPAPLGRGWYTAQHPIIVDETVHPSAENPNANPPVSANAVFRIRENFNPGSPRRPLNVQLSPRANVALAAHPSGITFIFGGETLNVSGQFQGLVGQEDSVYAYVPPAGGGAHTTNDTHGKWGGIHAGNLVRLNDGHRPTGPAPPFPSSFVEGAAWTPGSGPSRPDTVVPPVRDPIMPPAEGPPTSSGRSMPFQIVGSSAAIFIHEPPESNDPNRHPGPGTQIDPNGEDAAGVLGGNHYPWPDSPHSNWNASTLPPGTTLGVPVCYVLGGRTGGGPIDRVQKYYPYGFGTEDMVPYSQDFRFQTTNKQTDIWSSWWSRADLDHFPGSGRNFDPMVQARQPDGIQGSMPTLPISLYGHMAVRIESGVDRPLPTFPDQLFAYAFVMGGLDQNNAVRSEMYFWNTRIPLELGGGGGDERDEGNFSTMPALPTPRAYGEAVLLPGTPLRIAVVGGYDSAGRPISTIDIFTFDNHLDPNTGSWSTFGGTFEEALRTTAAGYYVDSAGFRVVTFGGYEEQDFTHRVRSARLNGGLITEEPLAVVPRGWHRAGQGGVGVGVGMPMGFTSNRYFVVGGLTEEGITNIIEVTSLP